MDTRRNRDHTLPLANWANWTGALLKAANLRATTWWGRFTHFFACHSQMTPEKNEENARRRFWAQQGCSVVVVLDGLMADDREMVV